MRKITSGFFSLNTVKEMIDLSKSCGESVKYVGGEVVVLVEKDSNPELIFRDYERALYGCFEGLVGPYPKVELSSEEEENDAIIMARYNKKLHEKWAEESRVWEEKKALVQSKLENTAPMEFSDPESWIKLSENSDPWMQGVMCFADTWARLMQLEMSEGKELSDVIKTTYNEAEFVEMKLSGGAYWSAINLLIKQWERGDELRRWREEL